MYDTSACGLIQVGHKSIMPNRYFQIYKGRIHNITCTYLYLYDSDVMNISMYYFVKLFLDMTGKGPSPIQRALDLAKADRKLDPASLSAAEHELKKLKSTAKNLQDIDEYKVIKKTMMGNVGGSSVDGIWIAFQTLPNFDFFLNYKIFHYNLLERINI